MTQNFEDGVEDVQQALSIGREVRGHGPYGILVGNERLEFKPVVINDPVPTGRQILTAAGFRDTLEHLLFLMTPDGLLQEVGPDLTVDLRSAGAERFLAFRNDRSFRFALSDRVIEWGATHISGRTLKQLAGVDPATFVVWLDPRDAKSRVIGDAELVDLSAPGVERFYTELRKTTVRVNTRPHEVHTDRLSFEQIVLLAFADTAASEIRVYTVMYKRGPASNPQGSLVAGHSVFIKDGMLFDVTFTDKS